jgi:hypothetical protein
MKLYKFDADQSFRQVRQIMAELNNPENRHLVAKLIWDLGAGGREPLTYLWDPFAERFGHQIDKEPIDSEIVNSLINEIPVEVQLVPVKAAK